MFEWRMWGSHSGQHSRGDLPRGTLRHCVSFLPPPTGPSLPPCLVLAAVVLPCHLPSSCFSLLGFNPTYARCSLPVPERALLTACPDRPVCPMSVSLKPHHLPCAKCLKRRNPLPPCFVLPCPRNHGGWGCSLSLSAVFFCLFVLFCFVSVALKTSLKNETYGFHDRSLIFMACYKMNAFVLFLLAVALYLLSSAVTSDSGLHAGLDQSASQTFSIFSIRDSLNDSGLPWIIKYWLIINNLWNMLEVFPLENWVTPSMTPMYIMHYDLT